MRGPWDWRSRWRVYAGAGAGLVALVVTLVLVVPGGGGSDDRLVADEATPTATATASPTPSASPTVRGTGSPAPARRVPTMGVEHLLSTSFVDEAFGQGRESLVATVQYAGAQLACWAFGQTPVWDVRVARAWSWPDEVLVRETLVTLPTEAAARSRLASCRTLGPNYEADPSAARSLELGDEAYLATRRDELQSQVYGGVRLGRALVLLSWNQSGRIEDSEPMERALQAATHKVLGGEEGTPVAATAMDHPEALRGFLDHRALLAFTREHGETWDGLSWRSDGRLEAARFPCDDARERWLPTSERPVRREWLGGALNGDDYRQVVLVAAAAEDESSAEQDFAACREAAGGRPIANLGDEAFLADWSVPSNEPWVFVRSGARYLVVSAHFLLDDPSPIARAFLDRYLDARDS